MMIEIDLYDFSSSAHPHQREYIKEGILYSLSSFLFLQIQWDWAPLFPLIPAAAVVRPLVYVHLCVWFNVQ